MRLGCHMPEFTGDVTGLGVRDRGDEDKYLRREEKLPAKGKNPLGKIWDENPVIDGNNRALIIFLSQAHKKQSEFRLEDEGMKGNWLHLGSALTIAAALAIWSAPVQATTFTFDDMYYVNNLTTFQSIFGATTTGYGTAGIYQETNTTTPTVTKLSNGSGVPGEYVQDTTPNANLELALFGWSQSLDDGQQVANVYNLTNPYNGTVLYFRYKVGGTTTPFTFNSFDLKGSSPSANLSFTLEGFLGGVQKHSTILTVTGNTLHTFRLNWQNIDTVEIVSTASLPVNWGSGTLYMDNVVINNPVHIAPTGMLLLLLLD